MKSILPLLLCFPLLSFGQSFTLSEQAEISVITCGPFQEELYSAFGHSAFRVNDPLNGFDAAYNYGVFDFNQPNFYLNFARGYLYYKLGVYDYQSFQTHYIVDNRYVHEQVLDLTKQQKQKMFDYLQWNAAPENQFYRYDYFYNNCATKMRDVVVTVFSDSVIFDGSYINTDYTIRELTDLYLQEQPWGDLGIDIGLGLPMDKTASPYEYMFLPDYVESGFDHAYLKGADGNPLPIVKKKNIIYESRDEDPSRSLPHPLIIFSVFAIAAIGLAYYDLKRKKLSLWFDAILFGATGLAGCLLVFLWFFTDHNAAARNMNILWAFPFHLIAIIAFMRNPKWLSHYFAGTAILSVVLLIGWAFLPQKLHYALIPLVVAQAVRAFAQYRIRVLFYAAKTNLA